MQFHQTNRMSNSDYLECLQELIKVYEHLSGEPGTSQTHVDALLANPAIATEAEKAAAKARAQEEYMAVLLLTMSDP